MPIKAINRAVAKRLNDFSKESDDITNDFGLDRWSGKVESFLNTALGANEAKETAARFLEKIGLKPVILHEQQNSGRTLIEKFETYSGDIAFAVVLLTPDDVGAANTASRSLRPRARQNVILELGYFMGRLGRAGVCALHKGGIELPSDYQGIVYIEMDPPGAWKAKLAQELIEAKVSIDLAGLVGG